MKRGVIRLSTLMTILLALLAGGALFWVSQQVQILEHEQRQIKANIVSEKEGIRVLDAEWDYLNRPDRLETLVNDHLKSMTPVVPEDLLRDAKAVPEPSLGSEDERTVLVSTNDDRTEKKGKVAAKGNNSKKVLATPDARPITSPTKDDGKDFHQVIDEMTGEDQ